MPEPRAVKMTLVLEGLLANPNLQLTDEARQDLAAGLVNPRLLRIIGALAAEHSISIRLITTGHPRAAHADDAHASYRAADIDAVDGVRVVDDPTSPGLVDVGRLLMSLSIPTRALRVMGPEQWHGSLGRGNRDGFRDDDVANARHRDHIHIGV